VLFFSPGVYFPACYSLIGKRIAPKDKSLCTSIVASGISVGYVLNVHVCSLSKC
jgi:hypothetical protein